MYPYPTIEATSVSALITDTFCTETSAGVNWYFPPNGINTVVAPIVESKVSTSPLCEATFKSFKLFTNLLLKSFPSISLFKLNFGVFSIVILIFEAAPFVFKKSLEISTIAFPLYFITSLFESLISATWYASKFSSFANSINLSKFCFSITTAILSCDSEIASSVPFNPIYFTLTLFKSISSPSASSPIATETPPAPKSLHFLINFVTFLFLKSLWIFLSTIAFPFCTSALDFSEDSVVCSLDEPVAPPIPSLPVLPPSKITTSPFLGFSRIIFSAGAAPTTSPNSILLAL